MSLGSSSSSKEPIETQHPSDIPRKENASTSGIENEDAPTVNKSVINNKSMDKVYKK